MKLLLFRYKNIEERKKVLRAFSEMDIYFDCSLLCVHSSDGNLKGFEIIETGSKQKKYYVDLLNDQVTKY